MPHGIFVGEEDLLRAFQRNPDLHTYSKEQLRQGIIALNFMGAGIYEYVVTKDSLFYPYLKAEGRKDVYVIG